MIAITGAAGFIGSNLAQRLAGEGHHLLLVDRPLTAAKAANRVGLERFDFIAHNLFIEMLHREAPPIEAVFHLGACSNTNETNWDYLRRNNLEYVQSVWAWCARYGRPFYYASSAATYGNGSLGYDDRISPARLRPLDLLGKSKNELDRWVLDEVESQGPAPPSWAGLKFFHVFGPRESHKGRTSSLVSKARAEILAEGEVRLWASDDPADPAGHQKCDFVFVEDCIDHLRWLWRTPTVCGLFNSGTGVARTVRDVARAVFAALGREPCIRPGAMPEELRGQPQNFTQADMSKLREAGCSAPPTSLEDGVRLTIAALDQGGDRPTRSAAPAARSSIFNPAKP